MGCSDSKGRESKEKDWKRVLVLEIQEDNEKRVKSVFGTTRLDVNELEIEDGSVVFNPLSFALVKGSVKCFVFMHKELNASIEKMEALMISQGVFPLYVVSQQGNLKLFKYYVKKTKIDFSIKHPGLFEGPCEPKISRLQNHLSYNSVQLLCDNGYVHILSHIFQTIKSCNTPSYEFDIEQVDDTNGENCALIACRRGNYVLIKFLQDNGANFNKKNSKGENALQILCSSHRKRPLKEFYECFFLLLNLKFVDYLYNYEETLLLIDDPTILSKFEGKLKEAGIFTSKKDIEGQTIRKNTKINHCRSEDYHGYLSVTGKSENVSSVNSYL